MENAEKKDIRETLILTNRIFHILLGKILERFSDEHQLNLEELRETQLFGFGNFDENRPSLKTDLETLSKGYINGKYLYNKNREVAGGKPFIKISRDYKYIIFNYLEYKDVYEFLKQKFIKKKERKEQLALLKQENSIEDYYYVCYYYGEDKKLNKGQGIIYKQWKSIEMKYYYEDATGKVGIYSFFGNIVRSEDFLCFDTKYYDGSKKYEGAKFFFYVGKLAMHEREFLIGTFTGYDKYGRPMAGKMILKKFPSREAMEEEVSSKTYNPIIAYELNKKRIIVESAVTKDLLQFSPSSPYASILDKIAKPYDLQFHYKEETFSIPLEIEKYHLNIKSKDSSIIIKKDRMDLISNGQILTLDFNISGVFAIQKVSIYIKTLELLNNGTQATGSFLAVDFNNAIFSGEVTFKKSFSL
ncbi:hypothetical protein [Galbibacter sp. PAP.153]|uniref:hypothetical protein n=1 Tax=Galbibacter sp. PAP.153 TaxID=3104623 RepID=UPI00300BADA6